MNLELIEKIEDRFPSVNPRELESEAKRHKFLVDFIIKYLEEFNVDTENVSRNQLNQPSISCGNEIGALINTSCAASTIIPNFNLSLFNLISPDPRALVSKVDLALRFHDFSDEVLTRLLEMCSPYDEKRDHIAKLMEEKNDLLDKIKRINVVRENKKQFIEQGTTEVRETEKRTQEYTNEKIKLELQLQQIVARKTNAMRKKTQFSGQLKGLRSKVESVKNDLLNHSSSTNSQGQIEQLQSDLKEITDKRHQVNVKKEEYQSQLADCNKLKQLAIGRTKTAQQILDSLLKAKEVESRINQKEDKVCSSEDIDSDLVQQEKENEKLLLNTTKQKVLLENTIKRNSTYNTKRNELDAFKREFKDVHIAESKLQNIDALAMEIQQNYHKHSQEIKKMRKNRLTEAREKLNRNNIIFDINKALDKLKK